MIKIKYDYKSGVVFVKGFDEHTLSSVYMEGYKVEQYRHCHGIGHSFDFGLPDSANILIVGDGSCYLKRNLAKKVLDIMEKAMILWQLDYEINIEPNRVVLFDKGKAKICM